MCILINARIDEQLATTNRTTFFQNIIVLA